MQYFQLKKFLSLDVNECKKKKEVHGCAQECKNSAGSYACECRPGYKLKDDGKNCQGRWNKIYCSGNLLYVFFLFKLVNN